MRNFVIVTSFLILSACSTGQIGSDFDVRDYDTVKLDNGLKVLLIEDRTLPYFSATMLVKTGYSSDPAGKSGLTSFVSELLGRGTQNHTAIELSDELGKLGTEFGASVDADYSIFSMGTLSNHQDKLLELFGEIMTAQRFESGEISRLRKQTLSSIQKAVDDPTSFASILYSSYLYGDHPYGRTSIGQASSVRSIERKDVIRHYLKYFRPNNAVLAVVGNFDKDVLSKIKKSFNGWDSRELEKDELPSADDIESRSIRLVDKSDLNQAQIRLGHFGIKRDNPDFLRLRVANTILGSGFVSRLMDQIRDNLGLTYSIGSSFESRSYNGPFTVSTFTKNETVGQTVSETLKILEEFRENGVTEKEVNTAKNYLLGVFPQAIDTPEKLAYNLLILDYYGISRDYLDDYTKNISRITTADVNSVIKKYLTPDKLKILIYANARQVAPQLKELGKLERKSFTEFR